MRRTRAWFIVAALLAFAATDMGLAPRGWAASTFKILHRFTGADGSGPVAGVALDDAGNLYGTTWYGGDLKCFKPLGCGVLFKFDVTANKLTVLHRFGVIAGDGQHPDSPVAFDSAGNLYGATYNGGARGEGSVFKFSTTGTLSLLASFGSSGFPPLGAIPDAAGNLYGSTIVGGGACGIGSSGCGMIFKLDQTGTVTELFHFDDGADGGEPFANVIRDAAGNLYGTAHYGGVAGCGTVYELDAQGNFTVLKTFNGTDGKLPSTGILTMDAAGNIYGAAGEGGNSNCAGGEGCGVIFKLTRESSGGWNYKVIHSFAGLPASGPPGGLVLDSAGNVYGTSGGGPGGELFRLSPQTDGSWDYQIIHRFGGSGGSGPNPNLVIDQSGNIYGMTQSCGADAGCSGVLYEITP
jgi:uncharacterized repeat protein (TIGR03803 family)